MSPLIGNLSVFPSLDRVGWKVKIAAVFPLKKIQRDTSKTLQLCQVTSEIYHLVTHFLTFMIKQQVWNFQNFPPFESTLALNVRRKHKVMIQIIVAWHVKKAIGKVAKDATTTPLLKP